MKQYKSGMYGGKFIPFHRGHLYCTEVASQLCEKAYLILFANGDQEETIMAECSEADREVFSLEARVKVMEEVARKFDNVVPLVIDVKDCKTPEGYEDWNAETPLVLNACGKFDAVFSSEVGYGEYFQRAYPWADHILVDPPRVKVPISATQIRNMTTENERKGWLV